MAAVIGKAPACVALASVMGRRGVASTLTGVSRATQVADTDASLDLALSPEHVAALDAASAPVAPHMIYELSRSPMRQHVVFGGSTVRTTAG